MNKLLSATLLILSFFSCSNNSDDDSISSKEQSIEYYFGVSSVRDSENDEERTFEIEIDGKKFTGIAPSFFTKVIKTDIKETHIKFKLNSSNQTNVVYSIKNLDNPLNEKWVSNGAFQDELDTIIKIKKN